MTFLMRSQPLAIAISTTIAIIVNSFMSPVFAGDPFRQNNPRDIGDKTEAAFEAIFLEGNYLEAKEHLVKAESIEGDDPLVHAMIASLAFDDQEFDRMKIASAKTISVAENLQAKDPLRANLYLALGHFLEGAYVFKQEGAVSAIPRLQRVLQYLDAAEKIDAEDPEYNLLKGYLDLILAVNLPFSSPEEAIERFQKYGKPDYMVNRGIATAYRDLYKQKVKAKQLSQGESFLSQAHVYLDKAIAASPENPELMYLKGQFYLIQGKDTSNLSLVEKSIPYFEKAKAKEAQLPKNVLQSLNHDYLRVLPEQQQLLGGN